MSAFLTIEYDTAYKEVTVIGPKLWGSFPVKRFASGDPVADFSRAVVFAMEESRKTGEPVMTTSSVNDFVYDVPGYRFNEQDLLEIDPRDWDANGNVIIRADEDV
jgi:hypothetical protein